MKVLFLVPYPVGEAPSQRFRFEQYFKLLNQNEIEFHTQSFWNIETWRILYKSGYRWRKLVGFAGGIARRIKALFISTSHDFIFIHRECMPVGPPVFEWILAKLLRRRIIYDFDDSIWLANTSSENSIAAIFKWHSKVESVCAWSWRVSCGNEFLAAYARRFNHDVIINPTTIDTDHHNVALTDGHKKKSRLTIGWTGTHSTVPYLRLIVPVIRALQLKYDIDFLAISDKDPKLELSNFRHLNWRKESEIEDLAKIDIGLMPLTDDVWAQGKCGLKVLQYMALQIPSMASAVGVNVKIINHGSTGFVCKDDHDWEVYLEELIRNGALRRMIGEKARISIVKNYSVESNSSNFLSLFNPSR